MKKNLLSIFICIIALFFITACTDNVNNLIDKNDNNTNNNTNKLTNENITAQNDYTELEIYGAKLRFKLANPTYLWDCNDNFGAGEIDMMFLPSKNGEEVEDYRDIENISGVIFQTSDDILTSDATIKSNYKKWFNLDVVVENIEHDLYGKHIKGENSKKYIETYAFKYDGIFEGEIVHGYYRIHLEIHKDDYTSEEIKKIIEEFHLIINTLEIIK